MILIAPNGLFGLSGKKKTETKKMGAAHAAA
jgi:hypothetical protein